MSISDVSPSARLSDATPMEWDAIKADRYTDNRDPKEEYVDGPFGPIHKSEMLKTPEVPYAPDPDPVNQPQHYRVGEVEAIDYIAQQLGVGVKDYLLGNLHKYIHRHRFKGQPVEDLRKARWYLDKLIMEEVQGG